MTNMQKVHVAIVGGGIVGLATAYQLTQLQTGQTIEIVEKEDSLGAHQSGRNSGVLHSGIYYKPGSLRAENCRQGKLRMEAFCREENIPFDICGKVIVATEEKECPALDRIFHRGQENGVACEIIDTDRLAELEPHAAGIKAMLKEQESAKTAPAVDSAQLLSPWAQGEGSLALAPTSHSLW